MVREVATEDFIARPARHIAALDVEPVALVQGRAASVYLVTEEAFRSVHHPADPKNPYDGFDVASKEEVVTEAAYWHQRATENPVAIMSGSAISWLMMPPSLFNAMRASGRRALLASEMTQEDLAAIINAEMPPGHDHLDALMEDAETD